MNKTLKRALSIVLSTVMMTTTLSAISLEFVYAAPDKNAKKVEKTSETPVIEVQYETGTQNNAKTRRDDTEAIKSENDGSFEVIVPGETVEFDENGEPIVTDEDPSEIIWEDIHIKDTDDFIEFANNCRLDTWSRNKNVYLDNDIIIAGSDYISVPTFGGHFNGRNYSISGYTMYEARSYTGLFDYVQEGASIENIVVKANIKAEGKQMVTGGIAGENHGEIRNCVFEGNLSGHNYVGGIAGYNELTGNILNCRSIGNISGAYYTGGIAGENVGNISSCINEASVNTVMVDRASSIQDIDLASYADGILSKLTGTAGEKAKAGSIVDSGSVDTGGIAGLSIGVIQFSENRGEVGYEHVGYNVGGIVGRQSGYVHACTNSGIVRGRKDVGGITGQAEPYVVVDLTEDVISKLSENIDKLHDVIDNTLSDAGDSSDTISNRLSIVKQFTDRALDETSFLSDKTIDWTNGMVGAGNELMSRAQYIMSETSKNDGPIDNSADAFDDAKHAASELEETVNDLNIRDYMDDSQKQSYDDSRDRFETLSGYVVDYKADYSRAAENYYIQDIITNNSDPKYDDSRDLKQCDRDGNILYTQISLSDSLDDWLAVYTWKHDPSGESMGSKSSDNELIKDAANDYKNGRISGVSPSVVETKAKAKAKSKYETDYSTTIVSVDNELADQASDMARIVIAVSPKMEEAVRGDASEAAESVEKATEHLESAGRQTKGIISEVASRGGISMPSLGEDYRNSTNALHAALQGMSDNMGALNSEMADSSDVMIDDMGEVNDQFNVIMQLYADAIDGVLDGDYGDSIEDSSMEVAETCLDATVADCENIGKVEGDIDVAGIAGAMGVEYDFDLESDITKSGDSKLNSTYQSKCVLRKNKNSAHIISQKSYAGGICGLQEIGTVLSCENYGKIKSNSSDYVGGISGESLSYIQKSVSKCFLVGKNYVGGIAGRGCNILNSYAMVEIDTKEADSFYGAIAGDVTDEGKVHYNYFVSDSLAGIDRVSYKGQAEPIDYATFISMETTPSECSKLYVVFYVDDVETDRIETQYGGSVSKEMFPVYVKDDGTYCKWDKSDLSDLTFDVEVEGEYSRYITTLASDQLRINEQSAILVDGRFKEGEKLQTILWDVNSLPQEGALEHWEINIPSGVNEKHLIRYKDPDNTEAETEIYINNAGRWDKVETGVYGAYKTFEVSGGHAELAVIKLKKKYTKEIIIAALSVLALAVVIIAIIIICKNKNRSKKALEKKPEAKENDDSKDKQSDDLEIINIDDENQ